MGVGKQKQFSRQLEGVKTKGTARTLKMGEGRSQSNGFRNEKKGTETGRERRARSTIAYNHRLKRGTAHAMKVWKKIEGTQPQGGEKRGPRIWGAERTRLKNEGHMIGGGGQTN